MTTTGTGPQRARLSEPGRVRATGGHGSGGATNARRPLIIVGPNTGGRSQPNKHWAAHDVIR